MFYHRILEPFELQGILKGQLVQNQYCHPKTLLPLFLPSVPCISPLCNEELFVGILWTES